MACHNCGRNFHDECVVGCSKCHPEKQDGLSFLKPDTALISNATGGEPKKRKELKDSESTGRKRAAKLYPINSNLDCEWKGKKNCGGGRRPIIGCIDGKQEHRHHGPVKKTTYNHEGNVHRICASCHVRWHEINDLVYDLDDYNKLPHMPEPASLEEVTQNHLDWVSGKMGDRYELKSARKGHDVEKELESAD